MRFVKWLLGLVLCSMVVYGEVPEITALVPEATGYEIIFKCNPLTWRSEGYAVDRSEQMAGKLTKVAYLLKLTDKQDKTTWVYAAFDAPTQNLPDLGIPSAGSPVLQKIINNLEVRTNSMNVTPGNYAHGNLEFWPFNYGPQTSQGLPDGSNSTYDFDDLPSKDGGYTSMQIHNYLDRQVVMAINKPQDGPTCELGIGNNTEIVPQFGGAKVPNPDWTFTNSGSLYKSAELVVAGRFDNLTIKEFVPLNAKNLFLKGRTDKANPVDYKVGEPIVMTLGVDFGGQVPTKEYYIQWSRRGDDGLTMSGKGSAKAPVVIKTSLGKPGFVHISANLVDEKGRVVTKKGMTGEASRVFFEGGAGAEIEKLQGSAEPADFDAFWDRQRARLKAMPLKPELTPVTSKDPNIKIYAVSIPCPGPRNRPCTGYLTIPANAQPKSLPAAAWFHGYGTSIQRAPGGAYRANTICFNVNAHGYDLDKDDKYYQDYFNSIRSNGNGYAFDPKENANPETAYFNGMALRLMRAFEFLMSLPEWNGKDLISYGGSQGGLQSCWAGGLIPQITETNPDIPWCCDMNGKEEFNRIHGGWRIVGCPALKYYDPINMGKRVPMTCFFNIPRAGLGDYCCPPSGVAILYNNVKTRKCIHWVQGSTHGYVPPQPNQVFVIEGNK